MKYLLLFALAISAIAQAHRVTDNQGTLRFKDNRAYLVISMSDAALGSERPVEAKIQSCLNLTTSENSPPLEGILISREPEDHAESGGNTYLTIMGVFRGVTLRTAESFSVLCFGPREQNKPYSITISDQDGLREAHVLTEESQTIVFKHERLST